jgi:hypothetical protein
MPIAIVSRARISGTVTGSNDAGALAIEIDEGASKTLSDGTGAGQANKVYVDDFTIAASGTLDFDLAGSLVDVLGVPVVFTAIKEILIVAADGNTNNVVMGPGTSPFLGPLGGTTPTVSVVPGGHLKLSNPSAAGWPVAAGSADILRLANSSAGTSVSGTITIVGEG